MQDHVRSRSPRNQTLNRGHRTAANATVCSARRRETIVSSWNDQIIDPVIPCCYAVNPMWRDVTNEESRHPTMRTAQSESTSPAEWPFLVLAWASSTECQASTDSVVLLTASPAMSTEWQASHRLLEELSAPLVRYPERKAAAARQSRCPAHRSCRRSRYRCPSCSRLRSGSLRRTR